MRTDLNPEVFRTAAQVIRTGGLAKGVYVSATGAHCTIGALTAVTPGFSHMHSYGDAIAELLGVGNWNGVIAWNDQPERTADEVAGVFDQAAEKAEANRCIR